MLVGARIGVAVGTPHGIFAEVDASAELRVEQRAVDGESDARNYQLTGDTHAEIAHL